MNIMHRKCRKEKTKLAIKKQVKGRHNQAKVGIKTIYNYETFSLEIIVKYVCGISVN